MNLLQILRQWTWNWNFSNSNYRTFIIYLHSLLILILFDWWGTCVWGSLHFCSHSFSLFVIDVSFCCIALLPTTKYSTLKHHLSFHPIILSKNWYESCVLCKTLSLLIRGKYLSLERHQLLSKLSDFVKNKKTKWNKSKFEFKKIIFVNLSRENIDGSKYPTNKTKTNKK